MATMKLSIVKRPFIAFLILFVFWQPSNAQDVASDLLGRINSLRASLGLPHYTLNSALAAAAQSHARWMADTAQVSHTQDNGSSPRDRARAAGYTSNWVSENIYMGANARVSDAWTFWVNSPVHYAGLTNSHYDEIGIGVASGKGGQAFVLVFGNSGTSSPTGGTGSSSSSGSASTSSARPQPSFVVGIDAVGNIMHEVQAGDTLGDIALIYGYTWADIPYMLSINGMSEADIRQLKVGSVFLVPPKNGTYTPSPEPTATTTQTPTNTPLPTGTSTSEPSVTAADMLPPVTFIAPPTSIVMVRTLAPTLTPTPKALETQASEHTPPTQTPPWWLVVLVVLQVGVFAGATVAYLRNQRTQ